MLLAPRCADPLYRRAIKVGMGAVFTMPWTRLPDWYDALPDLSARGFTTVALTLAPDATAIEDAVAGLDRVALVLGSEGHGLSARWEQSADRRAIIPMRDGHRLPQRRRRQRRRLLRHRPPLTRPPRSRVGHEWRAESALMARPVGANGGHLWTTPPQEPTRATTRADSRKPDETEATRR